MAQRSDEECLIPSKEPSPPLVTDTFASRKMFAFKVTTALFYAIASFLITIVNKSVLTSYKFPSFQAVAFGQMFVTVIVLYVGKKLKFITFPDLHMKTFYDIMPLPFIYVGNMVFGLGGTKELSLPMFTMLRRFSILMTMIAEYYVLSVRPRFAVKVSVSLMVIGAIIAASNDLGFNFNGYMYILISDFLTACNGVYTKKKLNSGKEMGKYGLMFYCALFMLPVSLFLMYYSGDLDLVYDYPNWVDPFFLVQFALTCTMGFILIFSVMLCTQYNSALTTTIIGCLKNILVTYLGMFIGGDYIFSPQNFVGINLSVFGSLLYTYVTFRPSSGAQTKSKAAVEPSKVIVA
ncbi:UDP-sugar transporter UST74c [Bemisia tabaci]|uniref:UDP-sugar transporter UST74c n=1 Tax=Bemisia tabaci TaxID=7038 RepID=UPI0008F9D988|nr:PREDICTED: UDP-sugar transporter UST74c-like [Bemisia tabaci]XP_018916036.1 PREDICTED: UDP-sugar transporter UST74c-like [Bemisia tabaci]XP_018916037.1 PREDICTED: UDP-sugar transporter UST74c-like [Bemisia tabaci]XP_018916038.1 PREDICTED: UDP-sugar transporter UST74c-like [Bemisia tabaci]